MKKKVLKVTEKKFAFPIVLYVSNHVPTYLSDFPVPHSYFPSAVTRDVVNRSKQLPILLRNKTLAMYIL